MFIDLAIGDHTANIARRILERGLNNISALLNELFGSDDFTYVACPDFSVSLRQRRLILGLPIGGYVNWSQYNVYPLQLDLNSCGVHLLKLPPDFDEGHFRKRLLEMKRTMDDRQFMLNGVSLKWNFTRRNHFINIYMDANGTHYAVFHSSAETLLFDLQYLKEHFEVKSTKIGNRDVSYIRDKDVDEYWRIAERENSFFFERHLRVFAFLFDDDYELMFADQHFGMLQKGEILMGCSKVKPNSVFPILTRPFEKIYLAKAGEPKKDIGGITDGFALVPHGLGMTLPLDIVDIVPDDIMENYVVVKHSNGSRMITDTLEFAGIGYRYPSVIPEMEINGNFKVMNELCPVLCLKL
jgi:hypothetical protein